MLADPRWSRVPLGASGLLDVAGRPKSTALAAPKLPLAAKDIAELAVRLLEHARRRIRNANWRAGLLAPAKGRSVDDLVRDAIMTLVDASARRAWDPERHPDPWRHLVSVVNSEVSDLCRASNRVQRPGSEHDWDRTTGEYPAPRALHSLGPDEHLDEARRRKIAAYATERLLEALVNGSDEALLRYHDIIETDPDLKRGEIAAKLGTTPEEVTNILKRYDRKINEVARLVQGEFGVADDE